MSPSPCSSLLVPPPPRPREQSPEEGSGPRRSSLRPTGTPAPPRRPGTPPARPPSARPRRLVPPESPPDTASRAVVGGWVPRWSGPTEPPAVVVGPPGRVAVGWPGSRGSPETRGVVSGGRSIESLSTLARRVARPTGPLGRRLLTLLTRSIRATNGGGGSQGRHPGCADGVPVDRSAVGTRGESTGVSHHPGDLSQAEGNGREQVPSGSVHTVEA